MGMIQCCLRGEPQDMHTGEPRRDGITGQQQGTPTTPNSASMITSNLVSQITFHQGQQQSQQGYQPPGLGVQQQPTGLLAHQMQMDKNKGYVTMSFPFQSTGSGQVGRPASVQSATTASQVPGAITYPSPRAIQQPANSATPPTAITGVVAPPKETSSPQPKQGVFTDTNPTDANKRNDSSECAPQCRRRLAFNESTPKGIIKGKWTEEEPQVGPGTKSEITAKDGNAITVRAPSGAAYRRNSTWAKPYQPPLPETDKELSTLEKKQQDDSSPVVAQSPVRARAQELQQKETLANTPLRRSNRKRHAPKRLITEC